MKTNKHTFAVMTMAAFVLSGVVFSRENTADTGKTLEQSYPNLAAGVLTYARTGNLPEDVLLKSDDVEITQEEIDQAIDRQPEQFQPELRKNAFFILEQEATGKLLKIAATQMLSQNGKEIHLSDDKQFIQDFFNELTSDVKVSDDDIETFYRENESIFCGTPLEKVRKQIDSYVLNDKKQRYVDNYIMNLGKDRTILVCDSWAKQQAANAKDNPLDKARSAGKPTLAIFSAASCCGPDKMIPVKNALHKKYDTKINIVYIEPGKEQILAARYGIRSIPSQIIYDSKGKEHFRHSGFFSEKDIIGKLDALGVQ